MSATTAFVVMRFLAWLKLTSILASCLILFLAGRHFLQYEEPANQEWVSGVSMVSFPFGCLLIATSIGVALWAVWRHQQR